MKRGTGNDVFNAYFLGAFCIEHGPDNTEECILTVFGHAIAIIAKVVTDFQGATLKAQSLFS